MTFYDNDNTFKNEVKKRDSNVCRRCGFNKNLHVHHIMPRSTHPSLEFLESNGVTLCGNCHSLLKEKESETDLRIFLPDDPNIDDQLQELLRDIDPLNVRLPKHVRLPKQWKQLLEGELRSRRRQERKAERLYNKGIKHYNRSEYDLAIRCFDHTLLLRTDPYDVYYRRGYAKYRLEQYKSAIYDFDNAIRIKPDDFNPYYWRGKSKYYLEQYKSACDDFDMSLRLKPDDNRIYWIYYFRGWAKSKMGRFDDAIANFNEALRLKPHVDVYRALGLAKHKLGQLDDAIADFDEGISLLSDKLNNLYHKAKTPQSNWEKEEKNIASPLQLLYINRGNVKVELSKICEARQDFQTALDLAPRSSDPKRFVDLICQKLKALDSLTTQHDT